MRICQSWKAWRSRNSGDHVKKFGIFSTFKFLSKVIPDTILWIPDPGVTDHAGQPILENSDFFVSLPIEIGRVISAETTLVGNKKAITTSECIKMMGVGFVVALVLLFFMENRERLRLNDLACYFSI